MSPQATYTPVEADALLAQYTEDASGTTPLARGTISFSIAPSLSFADIVPSKLTNGTGGGFGQSLKKDWVGFAGDPEGTVAVTVELGGPRSVMGIRTLFAGSTMSGIYFPQSVMAEYSPDGGVFWLMLGSGKGQNVGMDTPLFYAVGWVKAMNATPVIARQVRITLTFSEWVFIGEIKVLGPESQDGGPSYAMDSSIFLH
jgi:hypothetical protein